MGFSELGLSPEVLQAVSDAGYTIPTPIQEQAIPHVQRGRDVLGCAQTGTGKTASFVLPMIDKLTAGRARARMPRSLILEPTRELATQVAASFEFYGKHNRLTMALLIGGESFIDQERKLDRGVDVLIATPGRLLDLYGRGKILLSSASSAFCPVRGRLCFSLPRCRSKSASWPTRFFATPLRLRWHRPLRPPRQSCNRSQSSARKTSAKLCAA